MKDYIINEKSKSLTIKELKDFIKDLPESEEVWGYLVGFHKHDSWETDVVGLSYKDSKLYIDLNNIV